jgi:hypothetical protein
MRVLALVLLTGCLPDLGEQSIGAHAADCASCHPDEAAALATSRHATPDASPLFRALREDAAQRLDAAAFCDQCHAQGVTCLDCHAAIGALAGDGAANGHLVLDPTGPVRAGRAGGGAPHATVEGAFLKDSALCGTCHEVDGPPGFVEQPFSAWQEWGGEQTCQDCHLEGHRFPGLQAEPVDLLRAGLALTPLDGGVRIDNLAGHALPDGASVTRSLWLESRADGTWTGERVPLHPELLRDGVPIANPVDADAVVHRALPPRGSAVLRFERPMATEVFEVCVRFRPIRAALAEEVGLPVPEARTVACVQIRS